jgi:hypothetical protein
MPCSLQRDRRNGIQNPCNLIRRHLAILQAPDLASFSEALQSQSELPALRLVNEEDVFLAVGVADRGS